MAKRGGALMWGQIGYYTLLAITAEAIDADVNKDSVGFWLKDGQAR